MACNSAVVCPTKYCLMPYCSSRDFTSHGIVLLSLVMQFYVNDPTKTFCIGIKNITNWINLHDILLTALLESIFLI